ncbi:hypothetical protein PR202_gb06659 [Eleusine coracana subsp. coracana]|uniref:protein-serine/threonine phosphatase n=1 Tax=Eleusine coracana subsp. coracana TaxID=191504 RepID=A0AAV5EA45_ELECO|nr:hypothetical protein PR202_gb06659 [Eleusine coracana subsp. coracana]
MPSSPTAARRRRRRANKNKMNPGGIDDGAASLCPPHPGFVYGLCFLCGAKEEEDAAEEVAAEGPAPEKKSIPRASHLGTLPRARKLTLVLDLDHTLLNSTELNDLSPIEQGHGLTRRARDDPGKGLFRLDLDPNRMLTKLRPFVRGFLEQASAMFEMYVYTLGDQDYARGGRQAARSRRRLLRREDRVQRRVHPARQEEPRRHPRAPIPSPW